MPETVGLQHAATNIRLVFLFPRTTWNKSCLQRKVPLQDKTLSEPLRTTSEEIGHRRNRSAYFGHTNIRRGNREARSQGPTARASEFVSIRENSLSGFSLGPVIVSGERYGPRRPVPQTRFLHDREKPGYFYRVFLRMFSIAADGQTEKGKNFRRGKSSRHD